MDGETERIAATGLILVQQPRVQMTRMPQSLYHPAREKMPSHHRCAVFKCYTNEAAMPRYKGETQRWRKRVRQWSKRWRMWKCRKVSHGSQETECI
jgi:hypothetical protein